MLSKTIITACVTNLNGRGTPATKLQAARIDLAWSGISGSSNYQVLRSTSSSGPFTALGTVAATVYSDRTGLASGGTYYYVVQPLGSGGSATCQSNEAKVIIPAGH